MAEARRTIRMRATVSDGVTSVRSIIRHPMDNGYTADPQSGEIRPAHYIQEVTCRHNDRVVLRCDWSRAVSKNPYLAFEFTGAGAGDSLTIAWRDNHGATDSASIVIE